MHSPLLDVSVYAFVTVAATGATAASEISAASHATASATHIAPDMDLGMDLDLESRAGCPPKLFEAPDDLIRPVKRPGPSGGRVVHEQSSARAEQSRATRAVALLRRGPGASSQSPLLRCNAAVHSRDATDASDAMRCGAVQGRRTRDSPRDPVSRAGQRSAVQRSAAQCSAGPAAGGAARALAVVVSVCTRSGQSRTEPVCPDPRARSTRTLSSRILLSLTLSVRL